MTGRDAHAGIFFSAIDELKAGSAPDRLPRVQETLDDAFTSLKQLLASSEFHDRVGDRFSNTLKAQFTYGALRDAGSVGLPILSDASCKRDVLPSHDKEYALPLNSEDA